jgi:hypothetical protein
VVIGSAGGETRAAGPDDGLISAVDVAARGAGSSAGCAVVKAIRALLGVGATAARVEVTVSADKVEVGWARWSEVGVAFEPSALLPAAAGDAAFAVSEVADADAVASDWVASTLLALLVVVMPSDVVTVVLAPPLA